VKSTYDQNFYKLGYFNLRYPCTGVPNFSGATSKKIVMLQEAQNIDLYRHLWTT
jgi:hypothetical protein